MINIFLEEHHQILFALLKNKVNFMPIGGYAVIHYGYDRNSGGMDIWLQTGNENRDRLIHALRDLGITQMRTLKNSEEWILLIPFRYSFLGKAQGK